MADSWQELDSDGVMMDWSSVDTIKLCDLWHAFDSIKRALNERQRTSGTTLTTINRLANTYTAATALSSAIWTQVPLFINHADSSGNWSGKTAIPAWDETSILASINESKINPTELTAMAPFFTQAYKILNLLRWKVRYPLRGDESSVPVKLKAPISSIVSWADCESKFSAAAWSDTQGYYPGLYTLYGASYGNGQWQKFASIPKIAYSVSHSFEFNIDAYVHSADPYSDFPQFQYIDGITQLGVLNKTAIYIGMTSPCTWLPVELSEVDAALTDPRGANQFNNLMTWIVRSPVPGIAGVYKFDGPNGFKFKDW